MFKCKLSMYIKPHQLASTNPSLVPLPLYIATIMFYFILFTAFSISTVLMHFCLTFEWIAITWTKKVLYIGTIAEFSKCLREGCEMSLLKRLVKSASICNFCSRKMVTTFALTSPRSYKITSPMMWNCFDPLCPLGHYCVKNLNTFQ